MAPRFPRFLCAAHDLRHVEIVRRAAQRLVRLALGEGAELAAVITDVGVVDVAVHHVAHGVATDRLAQFVGSGTDAVVVHVACVEQPHDFAFVQAAPGGGLGNGRLDRRIDAVQKRAFRLRRDRDAGRPFVVARPAFAVGHLADARGNLRGEPAIRLRDGGRVSGQPRDQDLAHFGGTSRQFIQMRPGCFRIHVVRSHRRYTAPVVDAGIDQLRIDAGRQVRRRLDVDVLRQDQPRRGNAPQQVVQVGVRCVGALGVRLGTEVLHDDFANMAVTRVQVADGGQRFHPLRPSFADTDQDAGGELNVQFTRQRNGFQPRRRVLVRRTVMHLSGFGEALTGRFQHQAHAGGDFPQLRDLVARHRAWIDVRQQAGLLQDQRAHLAQVANGGGVAERVQRLARGAVAQFRLVAEGKQGLGAAGGGAGAGDGEHVIGRQIGGSVGARTLREGAVVADVAAQLRKRNEHLPRVRNQPAERRVALRCRGRHQLGQRCGFDPGRQVLVRHVTFRTTSSAKRCVKSSVCSMVGRCR